MAEVPTQLPANIHGAFNIALTSSKFQLLADEGLRLEFNEDNVEEIKAFLDKTKKVTKAIESTHKDGKAEALAIGRSWDMAKNQFLAQVDAITEVPAKMYDKICRSIQQKAQEAANERQRIATIKQGIENNSIMFAKKIADATTTQELLSIERNINLETSRKEKYQEFLPEAVEKFKELNSLLADQKKSVKEIEEIEAKRLEAKKLGDDEALIKLNEQKEIAESKVEENKVTVQETAIAQSMNTVSQAEPIINTVKPRRSVWKWEAVDLSLTSKKMPDWVVMQPNEQKIDDYLKGKKAQGIEGEEFTVAGIRFFLEKTF